MNYFVFRINYNDHYENIRKELLEGRLRQGWGAEGMTLYQDAESFASAWLKAWPSENLDAAYMKRKFSNLSIMKTIRCGDIIVIPKVSIHDKDGWKWFTVARCVKEYEFSPLEGDFGHILGIETIASFYYQHDYDTRVVNRSTKHYRSAVNNVYHEAFIAAVKNLIEKNLEDSDYYKSKGDDLLGSFEVSISTSVVDAIISKINKMGPNHFEKLIEDLFSSQGYHLMARNQYDGEGGDIDLVFSAYAPNTLMGDAFECSDEGAVPQIRIQAKKKKGEDKEDCEGINQLIKFDDHKSAINIVISTAEKFSEKARSLARDNGVFLINGRSFAQLLIKYGCQLRFDID